MMKVMMIITKMTQGECGEGNEGGYDDYQDDPGYSLDPWVREGERFGKEEGREANVFDLGWRKAPI